MRLDFKGVLILCYCLFTLKLSAQLNFCQGNSGDPIFTEDFGAGMINTMLTSGTTTYHYINGYPDDGFYTVSNGSFGNSFDWHEIEDHTASDINGRFLIINADFTAGEFFRTTVTGLCESTTYEFSAWLLNFLKVPGFCVDQGIEIPINVSFQIWDSTDSNLLVSGNTGDIFATAEPTWGQYGLVFQTLQGQNSVILKMLNNGQGGCGNDLAIDDIEFKSCGDNVIVTDENSNTSVVICENEIPYSSTITAIPDFSVFSSHFYQWQESTDGINWSDLIGETNQNLNISITSSMFYRTKVAEFAENLSNEQCILYSEIFQILVNQSPQAPLNDGNVVFNCELNEALLEVNVPQEVLVNWYDAAEDGNLLVQNTSSYLTNVEGVFFAEAVDQLTGCVSLERTAVSAIIEYPDSPTVNGNVGINCEIDEAELLAFVNANETVNWYDSQTGGNLLLSSSEIFIVSELGTYYAEAINEVTGCASLTRTAISVLPELQTGNCIIPQGISPGVSMGVNDSFDLSSFGVTQIMIYNRYGNLVYSKNNYTNQWEGQTNDGKELPVGTYFYTMIYRGGSKSRNGWVYVNR